LQEEDVHDEQPEPPDDVTGFSTPLIPKRENFFVMLCELHRGQSISGLEPETSFSKSSEQSLHVYS
jgi:hypothetical protein